MGVSNTHFIQAKIDDDRANGRWGGRVATRFPPEPNGFLHIGHAKAIVVDFGLAQTYGGTCNLRFDDTNPDTEDPSFAASILRDVQWLGYTPDRICYASDYFEQLYAWATDLIRAGLAYVDEQSLEAIRASRGSVTEPGTPSPWRDRPAQESLTLLAQMRAGAFADGAKVLRAKIDMSHPNMKMRDPVMYRIKHAHHWRTGDAWAIYPMYDWAHGQSDAIEGITHSICTLEFDVNRELYDWFTQALQLVDPPQQTEMARLELTHVLTSKRKLRQLVESGVVTGWDDPRMPTIAGLRRRGVTPAALRAFCEGIGVARAASVVDIERLDHAIRDDLNRRAPRRMAVLDPIRVQITNWPAGRVDWLEAPDFPDDVKEAPPPEGIDHAATRRMPFDGEIFIERDDFLEQPEPGFRRLVLGGEVRLRHAYVLRATRVLRDASGQITGLEATVDFDTLGANPADRKVRGVIHWVSAAHSVPARLQWVDRLFDDPSPAAAEDVLRVVNPDSLRVFEARCEPAVAQEAVGARYQFERHGYVYRAPEDAEAGLCFNLTVALKDRKTQAALNPAPSDAPKAEFSSHDPQEQAAIKAQNRKAWFADEPGAEAVFSDLVAAGASEDIAWGVVSQPMICDLHAQSVAVGADPIAAANWLATEWGTLDVEAPLKFGGREVAALLACIAQGTLSVALARKVFQIMRAQGGDPEQIAQAEGLLQLSDEASLRALIAEVLASMPDEAARLRQGDKRVLGFLMGQVMKASGGRANPQRLRELLTDAAKV